MSEPSPDTTPFPPEEIGAFLRCCAGEWMGLRSQFALGEVNAGDDDDDGWHTSDRGELVVAFLEAETAGGAGGLQVGQKDAVAQQQLHFDAEGGFRSGEQQGRWLLWPDGSLELVIPGDGREVRERIWFTKPNLRLRSTVETSADGSPGRASFSSEIRRVSRPTVPAS
ncbi:phycobiliprotein lyase [Cyanobium sp. BA5m-21]|uniref:phycobiliprotein lyase n=1 Tax=unclassified Cyanobium TaxID=2627006 RepID=UPI0020CF1A90|nr:MULTISPECIES: phycobiliprotein lyase [unclassified Cyanobium]MCP9902717.1 phycobiliprotein lyase [Cyanobium sp. BA5m-10]MCP9907036.1 phycobiliprotein lyase [Cyanobium sp. BA5m-21]